jgi:hypothetical protein
MRQLSQAILFEAAVNMNPALVEQMIGALLDDVSAFLRLGPATAGGRRLIHSAPLIDDSRRSLTLKQDEQRKSRSKLPKLRI